MKIFYTIVFILSIIMSGCISANKHVCPPCPPPSKFITAQDFKSKLERSDSKKLFLVFAAEWCGPCKILHDRLTEAGVISGVIFLDIDETWAFILSKRVGAKGTPTLAVIQDGKLITTRDGVNKILVYLLAHVEKK